MKKTLALILGVIMLMGCLSVSAANSALVVEEKPAKAIYFEDFSGETLDTIHVTSTESVVLENGELVAKQAAQNEKVFDVNMIPEGIKEPVFFEFELSQVGLSDVNQAQIILHLYSTQGDFMQYRWYNAAQPYINSMGPWPGYAPIKTYNYGGTTAKFKFFINPVEKTFKVWINGDLFIDEGETGIRDDAAHPYLYSVTNFTNLKGLRIHPSEAGIREIKLDNIKLYPATAAVTATPAIPVVGEEIYRQTFDETVDTFTASSNEVIPEINSKVTYTQANGALKMETTEAGGATKVYLQPNQQALTGKYVVETVLKNSSQTTYSSGYHRITFGNSGSHYLQWIPNKILQVRIHGASPAAYDDVTTRMAEFNANGDTLKMTNYFDTEAGTVTTWFNDVYAYTRTYEGTLREGATSIAYINFNLYKGRTDIADLRVYRPATFDSKGLSITEDANSVKIATNAAKDSRLYFATYSGDSLSNLGTTALNMAPGKVYKVSKADWAGAKAFFWDADQKPIVDSWDLQ